MAYSFSVSKLNDVLPFYTYQTLTDYDELKNEAESEVFDTWLNNLPKVLLWKLKYLANRNNLVKELEDAATVTENNKRSDYDRYRRGSYKELRRYG